MKATDVSMADEDSEEEENHARRLEGKSAVLKFTAEEYTAWCRPWMNSLIIKVLGASFLTYVIRDRIHKMWQPRDSLKLIPLNNGYYIVSFSNKEDRDYAYQEGPWMIEDHYLIVQRWRPNFNPWKADLKRNIVVWIRLPDVPFEFYNVESLRRIGNMVGKIVKIDRSTSIYDKGGFARLCVEVDLQQPLLPAYTVFGDERPIVYEGLHQVCFTCGKYGHQKEECLMNRKEEEGPDETSKTSTEEAKTNRKAPASTGAPDNANGSMIMTGGGPSNECLFGNLKILRCDFQGYGSKGEMKQEENNKKKSVAKNRKSVDGGSQSRIGDIRKEKKVGNIKGKDLKKCNDDGKSNVRDINAWSNRKDMIHKVGEWVQVGVKRKNETKGKLKVKENKPPARDRQKQYYYMGEDEKNISANQFSALQVLESGQLSLTEPIPQVLNDEVDPGPAITYDDQGKLGCVRRMNVKPNSTSNQDDVDQVHDREAPTREVDQSSQIGNEMLEDIVQEEDINLSPSSAMVSL